MGLFVRPQIPTFIREKNNNTEIDEGAKERKALDCVQFLARRTMSDRRVGRDKES